MPIPTRTFGRTRSGRSPWPVAVTLGVATSALLTAVAVALNPGPNHWLLAALTFAWTVPITTMGGWALLVDRDTVRGATPRPDESVEATWFTQASADAFLDLIAVCGLAAGVFSIVPALAPVQAWAPLTAITVFGMADFGVRYRWLRRRGA